MTQELLSQYQQLLRASTDRGFRTALEHVLVAGRSLLAADMGAKPPPHQQGADPGRGVLRQWAETFDRESVAPTLTDQQRRRLSSNLRQSEGSDLDEAVDAVWIGVTGFFHCCRVAVAVLEEDWVCLPVLVANALRCWPQPAAQGIPEWRSVGNAGDGIETLDQVFRAAAEQGWRVGEAWDTCRALLGQHSPDAETWLDLRVLGVMSSLESEETGFVGRLTLEWWPEARGAAQEAPGVVWRRHPQSLLLAYDGDFGGAFRNSLTWARNQEWGQNLRGEVRWCLTREGDAELPAVVRGSSLGGALAAGLMLLWDQYERPDPTTKEIAVSASVDAEGNLGEVGGMDPKWDAAVAQQEARAPIRLVIRAGRRRRQGTSVQAPLMWEWVSTVPQVVALIRQRTLAWRDLRAAIHERTSTMGFLTQSVPLKGWYQELPLLQEIPAERATALGALPGENPGGGVRPGSALLRWDEEVRQRTYLGLAHTLEEIFRRASGPLARSFRPPRFVLLAPPGGGKSAFLHHLAHTVSGMEGLPGQQREQALVPVQIRLATWEQVYNSYQDREQELDFAAFLEARYRRLPGQRQETPRGPRTPAWRNWLEQGKVFLLLDGLDETSSDCWGLVREQILQKFPACPAIVTCRTAAFSPTAFPGLPTLTLGSLTPDQQQELIRRYAALSARTGSAGRDAEQLIRELHRSPALLRLATNPLLLGLCCSVVDASTPTTLPHTQTQLYQRVVDQWMAQPPRHRKVRRQLNRTYSRKVWGVPPHRVEQVLARMSRRLLELSPEPGGSRPTRSLVYSALQMDEALRDALREAGLYEKETFADRVDFLLRDLCENIGLLEISAPDDTRPAADRRYTFLHLTFQEFLAAGDLAREAETAKVGAVPIGWENVFGQDEANGALSPAENWLRHVDRLCERPEWREVLRFLAGHLPNPQPLLELLVDELRASPPGEPSEGIALAPRRDDLFRHRLALATECLPEVRDLWAGGDARRMGTPLPADPEKWQRVVNAVTKIAFDAWDNIAVDYGGVVVGALHTALPALAAAGGTWEGRTVEEHLVTTLQGVGESPGSATFEAPGVAAVAAWIRDPEVDDFRRNAMEVMDGWEDTLGREQVETFRNRVEQLPRGVEIPGFDEAVQALEPVVQADGVRTLLEATRDPLQPQARARGRAARSLGDLGLFGSRRAVSTLLDVLSSPHDQYLWWRAARALAKLGDYLEREDVSGIVEMAASAESQWLRRRGAELLGWLPATQPVLEAVPTLGELIRHSKDDWHRVWAAYARARLRGQTLDPEEVQVLRELCTRSQDPELRWKAAGILEAAGKQVNPASVEMQCLALIQEADPSLRSKAAETLGKHLAEAPRRAATPPGRTPRKRIEDGPDGTAALVAALIADPAPEVRGWAALALGMLGSSGDDRVPAALIQAL